MNTAILKDALRAKLGADEYGMSFADNGVILSVESLQLRYESLEEIEQDAQAGLPKLLAVRDKMRREQQRSLLRIALTSIASALCDLAGADDMASVQLDSEGGCILRNGMHDGEYLNIEQFVEAIFPEPASV